MKKFKLTKTNYYTTNANQKYWSASFVKAMLDCPERAIAEYTGEYEQKDTTALQVGSYIDAIFEGPKAFDRYKGEHPELFKRDGSLKAEFVRASDMATRAKADKVFMEYMRGQKQKIFTGTIEGIPFKCKLDIYRKGERIVDLKTVKDLQPVYKAGKGKLSPIDAWEWPLQLAIYQELCFQNTGERLPCFLAIITKEDPPDLDLVQIPQEKLDLEMEYLKGVLPELEAMRMGIADVPRCASCAYCRKTHKISAPRIYDFMEELI